MPFHRLYRIATPYSVAGVEANSTGQIVFAAPILRRAWLGRQISELLAHCQAKGWEVFDYEKRGSPRIGEVALGEEPE